jgi:glycyl-tRNA synthetase beta chain
MPQLLLELFSEEIPARMQAQAGRDLERLAKEHLAKAGLVPETLTASAGPRRLTLVGEGLPAATPDREEELKGPRTNAPEQALDGFLRKTGLTKAQLSERDGVWFATLATPGRATAGIVAEMVPAIMAGFPWPKSMRSGSSHFRWVRPLKRILCLFDGKIVPFEVGGVTSGDLTEGHRFMGSNHGPFAVKDFAGYRTGLRDRYVLIDQAERKRLILDAARAACAASYAAWARPTAL